MSTLKKALRFTLALVPLLILIACTAKTETASFQLFSDQGADSRLTYYYQGDKVIKQTAQNTILYSVYSVQTKEEAKELLKEEFAAYDNLKGVTHEVTYDQDRLIQSLEVDYSKADLKEIGPLIGLSQSDSQKIQYISYKESKQLLENQGYKEVKNNHFQAID